jgi:hypothetical protein
MTANHTARLGLMKPVDTDIPTAADFSDTFQKLDDQPGTKIVANWAAVQAYSTSFASPTAHHGEQVIQMDNLARWVWVCPSGSGAWQRVNSIGLLDQPVQSADVTSTATTGNGALVLTSNPITYPGKRPIRIDLLLSADNDNSNGNGMAYLNLMLDGSPIKSAILRVGGKYGENGTRGTDQFLSWWILNPAVNDGPHTFGFRIRAVAGTIANGAQGTVASRNAILTITEV